MESPVVNALAVLAPVSGRVSDMGTVPDPVFSAALVGPGVAIDPDPTATTAVAPVAGRVVKLHPHAFVIAADDGRAVLVHLGIDTVELAGAGFELLVTEGDVVEPGQPIVRWDPSLVRASGRSSLVPVVALEAEADELQQIADLNGVVHSGDRLFDIA